jgi:ribosomal protein L12E/L44/L45/RPP1/RPP2
LTRISNTAAVSPSAPEASDRPAAAMPREVKDGGRDDAEEEEEEEEEGGGGRGGSGSSLFF